MATQLFLLDTPLPLWQHARYAGYASQGGQSTRAVLELGTARGDAGVISGTVNTQQLFGGYLSVPRPSGGGQSLWITEPLAADVTIAGTITFNFWGLESSMSANFGLACRISRLDHRGVLMSTVITSERNVELGTSAAVQNWTGSPTSTNFQKGDRIAICAMFDEVGTGGSGFTATFSYDGPTAAANGDTYVTFTEDLTFMTGTPAGTKFYFRDAVESTATGDADFVSKQLSTTRGSSATSKRALTSGGTGQGSVSDPLNQFVGDTTATDTGYRLPETATNVDTVSGGNWSNPTNVLTDNGAVASVTTQAIGQHDELHMDFDFDDVVGRIVGGKARAECRQINATGFDSLRFIGGSMLFGFGTLTSTLTLFTQDSPNAGSGILAAPLRNGGSPGYNPGYLHDDGTGSQGFTTEIDYIEFGIYYQTVYEWFTPPLQAFTLSGLVMARLRGARATGFASPDGSLGLEVAVTDGDGSNPVVYGWGYSATDTNGTVGTETTLETVVAGDDISVSNGQRIRVRVVSCAVYDDHYGGGFSNTDFFYDGPTADASGDSWIQLTETVSESAGPAGGILPPWRAARDRYGVGVR